MKCFKADSLGLTLIELLIALAIIVMIAVAFFPLFTLAARTNQKSEETLDATYLGKDVMEFAYGISREINFEGLEGELIKEGYEKLGPNIFGREYGDHKFLELSFAEVGDNNLIRVIAKIYEDSSKSKLDVQYEALYSWKGRGILNEDR
ncbi:MAG: prepilin-type N-terminal cleavage/methylation domain-containing protein [Bacillota bacterium]